MKEVLNYIDKLQKESANKDKVINLMAKKIKEEDPICGVLETPIEKIIQRYYEKAGDIE